MPLEKSTKAYTQAFNAGGWRGGASIKFLVEELRSLKVHNTAEKGKKRSGCTAKHHGQRSALYPSLQGGDDHAQHKLVVQLLTFPH